MKGKRIPLFLLAIIAITLPILLLGIRSTLNNRSNAAAADKLEAEGGSLGGNATIQTDSQASSGNFVALGINQTPTPTIPSSGIACIYPSNIIGYTPITRPNLSRPEYLVKTIDPIFNTEVIRIGENNSNFGSNHVMHNYSKNQPWNSDGTLLKLAGKILLDGKTYVYKGRLPAGGLLWSHINPNKLYGVSTGDNSLYSMETTSSTRTILQTFPEYTQVTIGADEGNLSNDDRYVALIGTKSTGENWLIIFDILNKVIISQKSFTSLGGYNQPDWASMSQSGNYVVVNWRQRPTVPELGGVISYDRNLNKIADLAPLGAHGDIGYDTLGNEIYAQVGNMMYYRLDNGVGKKFLPYNLSGHLSMRNIKRPGWAYFSSHDIDEKEEGFAVKMDGSGVIERFAHLHTYGNVYESEAHLVPNQDGTIVLWKGDWVEGSDRTVYPYVAAKVHNQSNCIPQ